MWIQPIDIARGTIALARGARVQTRSGGHRLDDEGFFVPAPVELHLPVGVTLDAVILEAAYEAQLRPASEHTERSHRIGIAMSWITKSWLNSESISESDRLVFLKTASEALTRETRASREAAMRLTALFQGALHQEGEGLGVDDLLWSPDEPCFVRTWSGGRGTLPALEHWYMSLARARNNVVHALAPPAMSYDQEGSPYVGPLVEVADRVLREAVAVELGACGYPEAWRRGVSRASLQTLRQVRRKV